MKRNVVVAGLWCGGVAVTLVAYEAATGGGTYVVTCAAIIFGGWQFLKGLMQYVGAGNP